jgi:hypothetical protein
MQPAKSLHSATTKKTKATIYTYITVKSCSYNVYKFILKYNILSAAILKGNLKLWSVSM